MYDDVYDVYDDDDLYDIYDDDDLYDVYMCKYCSKTTTTQNTYYSKYIVTRAFRVFIY